MGYLKTVETDHLVLPTNKEFWVRMKRAATWGDTSAAQRALIKIGPAASAVANANGGGLTPAVTAAATTAMLSEGELDVYLHTLVFRLIVEWNLTDAADKPLPVTIENVALLAPDDGDFLSGEAQKRIGGRPAAKQLPFKRRSGRR